MKRAWWGLLANFPMVFAGTDTNNLTDGHYDPVYPPGGVNLHWQYEEWPAPPEEPPDVNVTPVSPLGQVGIEGHVGEYNGAWAEGQFVYFAWTDYRLPSLGTRYGRNQSDVRFGRLSWPQ